MATNFTKELIVTPRKKVKLRKYDPEDTLGWEKGHKTNDSLEKSLQKLDKLQYLLYADRKSALLVVLQGLDAGGKDGTIRHVMTPVPRLILPRPIQLLAWHVQLTHTVTSSQTLQVRFRLVSTRARRASWQAALSSSGT